MEQGVKMSRKQNDFVSRWQFWKCANERVFCNNCYNKGIKKGKQIREDEIIKKLDGFCFSLDNKEDILIRNKLKQKIKGDEK